MKILAIHADYLNFEAKKKAFSQAEEIEKAKEQIKECLVVFTAVEKEDEKSPEKVTENYLLETKKIAEQINTKSIVLYPYAHLSPNLSDPKIAVTIMKKAEEKLINEGFSVKRAPFGWYKSFEISCKGHPLSELSRSISAEEDKKQKKQLDKPFEFNEEKLTKEQKINLTSAFLVAKVIKENNQKAEFGILDLKQDRAYLDVKGIKIKKEQFAQIENRIKKLLKKPTEIVLSKSDGQLQKEIEKDLGNKSEIYSDGEINLITNYKDPFFKNTGEINAFKMLEVASAYWKNNSANDQLTRIYFVGFENKEKLIEYENKLIEAEKRDHRKIGQQLKLFSMHKESPGMPFFHDNGMYIYRQLENFMLKEMRKLNYEINRTPLILNKNLWLQSGHWDHYKDNMYFTKIDGDECAIKPMNCPGNVLIFKNEPHSYKELPIKAGEFGLVHRHELSGVLSGLFRVRCFTQDDAHVFCTEEQIKEQIIELLDLINTIYSTFGFTYELELSTKPQKAMGDEKLWEKAESALASALDENKLTYKINPGDGAFYGPKIDFHIKDALNRSWQCGTIQLDFSMPEKFDLTYEGADGKRHRPVMLHRAIYGSFERFFGILTEHYAGKFPLWLSPRAVRILTVTDRSVDFAKTVYEKLFEKNIRVNLDSRTESLGRKIREAQLDKVNYIITIGDKEVDAKELSVRNSFTNKVTSNVKIDEFVDKLVKEINEKK